MTTLRKAIAVALALRASTNFAKPFVPGARLVVLGKLMGGVWATAVAPLLGVAILVYAVGLWRRRQWARPLGIAYAIWSSVNVIAFPLVEGVPERFSPWMYGVFGGLGIVGPWLAVILLGKGTSEA